jgi:ribonuclease Z
MKDVTIIPLGIKAGGSPTAERHPSSYYLHLKSESILVDAGEGTQYQLLSAKVNIHRLSTILITHLHGDHCLGLIGILSNMTSEKRIKPLTVVGPVGIEELIQTLLRLTHVTLQYQLSIIEIQSECELIDSNDWTISCFEMEHRIPCYGYVFTEKVKPNIDTDKAHRLGILTSSQFAELTSIGSITIENTLIELETLYLPSRNPLKIVVCGDSRVNSRTMESIEGADIVIHEATFGDEFEYKAHERYHSTARQVAVMARSAQIGRLYLSHFSNRHPDTSVLLSQAREEFANSFVCEELKPISVVHQQ